MNRAGVIGIFFVAVVVLLSFSCTQRHTVPPPDPLANYNRLVTKDDGLSEQEKQEWILLIREQFHEKSFSFDYSRLVYGIMSQAKFDEVDMKKAAIIAFASAKAVNRGAPEDEVSDLALFAFSSHLSTEEIRLYAITAGKCRTAGVPVHVTQEMIRLAKEGGWTDHTFTTIMNGLIKASEKGYDAEKVGLFMLISIAQNLGTPEQIVKDALKDARKRTAAATNITVTKPVEKDIVPRTVTPKKVDLDYETFQKSVESFLGTPYVWGGNTRRGVDCSGFTKLVMYENGYTIPRVSRDQAKIGAVVRKPDLKLGDLVFFDTKGRGYITHVGLYLGGNLLVHASSSKGVIIVLFSNRYFQSRYVSSRRVVRYTR